MTQQLIAIFLILFFILRLVGQKNKKTVNPAEFSLWMLFWLAALISVVFIRQIDALVASLGFSSSGIDVLLYFSIAILFYLLFRIRLKLEAIEKNITELVRNKSLDDAGNLKNEDKL